MVDKGINDYVYVNVDAAKVGVLIAAIVVAAAAFVGVFFHAKEYAQVDNGTVMVNK